MGDFSRRNCFMMHSRNHGNINRIDMPSKILGSVAAQRNSTLYPPLKCSIDIWIYPEETGFVSNIS